MFGNPETTTGGNALKFYSSVRLDVRRIGAIKNGEDVVGNRTAVKVVKNKMAPPFAKVEFDLMYGEGISAEGDIVDLATKYELIEKSGAWYSYNGERMGQGRDQAKNFLKENKAIMAELRRKILELNKIGVISAAGLADADADAAGKDGGAKDALAASGKDAPSAGGAKDASAGGKEMPGASAKDALRKAAAGAKKPPARTDAEH
jgi:recombination protein RecA